MGRLVQSSASLRAARQRSSGREGGRVLSQHRVGRRGLTQTKEPPAFPGRFMLASERDIAQAKGFVAPPGYRRHRPETTLLYQLVAEHYPKFRDRRVAEGRALPRYVEDEFEAYLKCGLLEHGFLRVKCDSCQAEKLVAFSCKRRGFCPSCGARRMVETAALLVDQVLPRQPIRQWVLSLPIAL